MAGAVRHNNAVNERETRSPATFAFGADDPMNPHATVEPAMEEPPIDRPTDAEPTVPPMHEPDDPERPLPPPADPFHGEDFAFFDRDDSSAGSHIGKMLAFFFLYTVIVMAIVALWTIAVTR